MHVVQDLVSPHQNVGAESGTYRLAEIGVELSCFHAAYSVLPLGSREVSMTACVAAPWWGAPAFPQRIRAHAAVLPPTSSPTVQPPVNPSLDPWQRSMPRER